jgi:RNA polymerase sigma factor (sigma-70 family)
MIGKVAPDLESVFRKYRDFVHRICVRYMKNAGDAEDLSQEVFLKLHHRLPGFRGDSQLSTWIYRIAVNCCLDGLRARKARTKFDDIEMDDLVVENISGHGDAALARIDLARILDQTDDRTREILFLALAEGCSYEEVGEVVGMTRWAVAKVVTRFQKKMRPKEAA